MSSRLVLPTYKTENSQQQENGIFLTTQTALGSWVGVGSGVVGRPISFLDPCIQIEFKRKNKNIITWMRTVMKRVQYGNVPEIRIHVGLIWKKQLPSEKDIWLEKGN